MNIKRDIVLLAGFSMVAALGCAQANKVTLSAKNQPVTIQYHVARGNVDGTTVIDPIVHKITIKPGEKINVELNPENYSLVGIASINVWLKEQSRWIPIPSGFNEPSQCSIATSEKKTSGSLEFSVYPLKITCSTRE